MSPQEYFKYAVLQLIRAGMEVKATMAINLIDGEPPIWIFNLKGKPSEEIKGLYKPGGNVN